MLKNKIHPEIHHLFQKAFEVKFSFSAQIESFKIHARSRAISLQFGQVFIPMLL